uniref:inactive serine/threonine-protein kinase VRK3 isoform X2 n=1 Tax=Doryrhamphus excisus TaxID=161450 RepID=UPI0025AE3613|nr:inactive serine/threonine-protein kinase VRK3 isoform X2 [Doryrhamphus excisus]
MEDSTRVTFRFCPQCGTKLQSDFKFCPSCGKKIPCSVDTSEREDTSAPTNISPSKVDEAGKESIDSQDSTEVRGKARLLPPVEEGEKSDKATVDVASGASPKSKALSKAKKPKHTVALQTLENGTEMTDKSGRKWTVMQLLSQSVTEFVYQVVQKGSKKSTPSESSYILKMGAKDGRIFNEQNFLQRAAKPSSVEKWIKQQNMDLLGIPTCAGFGLYTDSYRFLIFSSIGQSLPSVMQDKLLPEKTVLHLTCRLLDVLHYIHSNEYVHCDVKAENIYIQSGQATQVYLVGYSHAFRYCPSGKHVEYAEGRRALPEGSLDFISLDAHKGVAPSRRSDLQSLGYCMLHWHTGVLPWSTLTDPDKVAALKQRYMDDVPALLSHCFGQKRDSSAFLSYLTAVANLQYTEQPNYSELRAKLSAALTQLSGHLDEPLVF